MLAGTRKWWLVALVLVVALGVLAGCGSQGETAPPGETSESSGLPENGDASTGTPPGDQALPPADAGSEGQGQQDAATTSGKTVDVTLYFSDANGKQLVRETRAIPMTEGIGRAAIQELIKGPSPGSGLLPTIPYGTKLQDINVRSDGTAIVDFSPELAANHLGGKEAEDLTVYSIVNTLSQFPSVQRVQIWIDGQVVETLAGEVGVSQALTPNSSMVAQ